MYTYRVRNTLLEVISDTVHHHRRAMLYMIAWLLQSDFICFHVFVSRRALLFVSCRALLFVSCRVMLFCSCRVVSFSRGAGYSDHRSRRVCGGGSVREPERKLVGRGGDFRSPRTQICVRRGNWDEISGREANNFIQISGASYLG